jgi:hypothetical protein
MVIQRTFHSFDLLLSSCLHLIQNHVQFHHRCVLFLGTCLTRFLALTLFSLNERNKIASVFISITASSVAQRFLPCFLCRTRHLLFLIAAMFVILHSSRIIISIAIYVHHVIHLSFVSKLRHYFVIFTTLPAHRSKTFSGNMRNFSTRPSHRRSTSLLLTPSIPVITARYTLPHTAVLRLNRRSLTFKLHYHYVNNALNHQLRLGVRRWFQSGKRTATLAFALTIAS